MIIMLCCYIQMFPDLPDNYFSYVYGELPVYVLIIYCYAYIRVLWKPIPSFHSECAVYLICSVLWCLC